MKLTYAIIMVEGSNNWDGYTPDILNMFTAGDDIEDMRNRLRNGIKAYVEDCAERDEPIPWPTITTVEEALEYEAKTDAEYAAEYPDDPTDEEEGWSPPIAEMIEIEVNLPQTATP